MFFIIALLASQYYKVLRNFASCGSGFWGMALGVSMMFLVK